jgi:hypothetical protein
MGVSVGVERSVNSKWLRIACCVVLGLGVGWSRAQDRKLVRNCASPERYQELVQGNTDFRDRAGALNEESTKLYGLWAIDASKRPEPIIIPVVVHVVFNTEAQKISEAQVGSQIEVLNRDFGTRYLDQVPERFRSLAAKADIQFKLAVRDPEGKGTSGITYTKTKVVVFSNGDGDAVKSTARGGHDPWPRDDYLNLWVCNLEKSDDHQPLLGYSSWPLEPAAVDGVVILYRVFGTAGVEKSDYDQGRTATHEIGHWLNLHHLWGDGPDNAQCDQDDGVADTPKQKDKHYDCPNKPVVSCDGPKGDMFMDYMDYSPDKCMCMFTVGQVRRMQATIDTARASLRNSKGLDPPTP